MKYIFAVYDDEEDYTYDPDQPSFTSKFCIQLNAIIILLKPEPTKFQCFISYIIIIVVY